MSVHRSRGDWRRQHVDSPALQIHSKYPLSSRSICCWRRNLRKARRLSTRSRSLANSLDRQSQTRPGPSHPGPDHTWSQSSGASYRPDLVPVIRAQLQTRSSLSHLDPATDQTWSQSSGASYTEQEARAPQNTGCATPTQCLQTGPWWSASNTIIVTKTSTHRRSTLFLLSV